MQRVTPALALVALAGTALAQTQNPFLQSANVDVLPLEEIAATFVDGPDMAAVEAQDAQREVAGLPPRFAMPTFDPPLGTSDEGQIQLALKQTAFYRMVVQKFDQHRTTVLPDQLILQ